MSFALLYKRISYSRQYSLHYLGSSEERDPGHFRRCKKDPYFYFQNGRKVVLYVLSALKNFSFLCPHTYPL